MKGIIYILLNITKKIIVIFSLALVIVVLLGIFSRYVLCNALPWTGELAIFLLVWIVFLGISVVENEQQHIGMFFIKDKIPLTLRKYLEISIKLLVLFFLIIVSWQGFRLAYIVIPQRSAAMRISFFWPYISIPVGAILMSIQIIYFLFILIKKKK